MPIPDCWVSIVIARCSLRPCGRQRRCGRSGPPAVHASLGFARAAHLCTPRATYRGRLRCLCVADDDPHSWVGSSPLADVPCLPELPTLIRLKYLSETNRWTRLPRSGVARLHAATAGDLAQSLLWDQMLRRFDVVDVASMVFVDRFGCWGFLDLWRSAPAQPFTDADATFLASLAASLSEGLRRSQAATFTAAPAEQALNHSDPAVLLLSADLAVVAQTSQSEHYLGLLSLPAAVGTGSGRRIQRRGPTTCG